MRNGSKKHTFTRMIHLMVAAMICVVIVNALAGVVVILTARNEISKNADAVISSVTEKIVSTLKTAEQTMLDELSYDTDITRLTKSGGIDNIEYVEQYMMTTRLKRILESLQNQYAFMLNYVIYIPETDVTITSCKDSDDYLMWYEIEEDMKNYVLSCTKEFRYDTGTQWQAAQIAGYDFLIKYYRMDERYMFCYISLDSMLNSSAFSEGSMKTQLYLLDHAGNYAIGDHRIDFSQIYESGTEIRFLSGQIIGCQELSGTEFYMGIIAEGYSRIIYVLVFQLIIGTILAVASIGCVLLVLYIRKTIISPIQQFSENIEKLKADDTYSVATHYQINELGSASQLLAEMVNKIKGLKIDIYEKTLQEQKIQTDFLSLQIEPHFYLNCLNIIYNLAELERYREIQVLSKCVSDYLRYIFRHHDDMVRFKDELEHIRKYLEIQRIRYKGGFNVQISAKDDVMEALMPPLVIQTFVENAIKHTVDWEEEIEISLKADKVIVDNQTYIAVSIEDSGEGFSEDILGMLTAGKDISQGDQRIGIMNAIRRLELVYGGMAVIRFYNHEPHGAGVFIRIPYDMPGKDEGFVSQTDVH